MSLISKYIPNISSFFFKTCLHSQLKYQQILMQNKKEIELRKLNLETNIHLIWELLYYLILCNLIIKLIKLNSETK